MTTLQFLDAILAWLQADPVHASAAAAIVVALTPTPNPSSSLGKLYKILEIIALNFGRAKESGIPASALADEVAAALIKKQQSQPKE